MELATVHKYSIFIEFPQDGAYRLVEMQHCRNSVELLHEMLSYTVKELVGKKNKTRSTWEAWRTLKKLGLPSAIVSGSSYASFVLSKFPTCYITR